MLGVGEKGVATGLGVMICFHKNSEDLFDLFEMESYPHLVDILVAQCFQLAWDWPQLSSGGEP